MQESDIHGNKKVSDYGKICFYNGFLYLSKSEMGIYIFDDAEPSPPCVVGFIELVAENLRLAKGWFSRNGSTGAFFVLGG